MSPPAHMRRQTLMLLIAPCVLAACARAAAGGSGTGIPAEPRTDEPEPPAAPRVLASAREIRVIFPRDTARSWGWPVRRPDRYDVPAYYWSVILPGLAGPRELALTIQPRAGEEARRFGTLADLVAGRRAVLCEPAMEPRCTAAGVSASVERGSLVLSLGDTAQLARILGTRPVTVRALVRRPEQTSTDIIDGVRVQYVGPPPEPDSALIAETRAELRRYLNRTHTVFRTLTAPGRAGAQAWLSVGDSVPFGIQESRCREDSCVDHYDVTTDSGWTAADTSVVRLRPSPAGARRARVTVIARREGRTRVRVRGLAGEGDSLPTSRPVARALEVEVVVVPPVARVRMTPRISSGRVGETIHLQATAFDAAGRVVPRVPVEVVRRIGNYSRGWRSPVIDLSFDEPGQHVVTASFGGRADTLIVNVEPGEPTAEPRKPGPRATRTDRDPAGQTGPPPSFAAAYPRAPRKGDRRSAEPTAP